MYQLCVRRVTFPLRIQPGVLVTRVNFPSLLDDRFTRPGRRRIR